MVSSKSEKKTAGAVVSSSKDVKKTDVSKKQVSKKSKQMPSSESEEDSSLGEEEYQNEVASEEEETGSDANEEEEVDDDDDSEDDETGSDANEEEEEVDGDEEVDDEEEEVPAPKSASSSRSSSPVDSSKTLYVGNLSYETTEKFLNTFFSKVGEVSRVRIITDQRSGRSKGFGYVDFSDESSVQKAIDTLQGSSINGRQVKLDVSTSASSAPRGQGPTPTLFVGNLSYSVTESQLRDSFSKFGQIVSARIPTGAEDGRSRGYGYVQFSSSDAAKSAKESSRLELDGRIVRVDYDYGAQGGNNKRKPFSNQNGRGGGGRDGGFKPRGGRGSFSGGNRNKRYFDNQ